VRINIIIMLTIKGYYKLLFFRETNKYTSVDTARFDPTSRIRCSLQIYATLRVKCPVVSPTQFVVIGVVACISHGRGQGKWIGKKKRKSVAQLARPSLKVPKNTTQLGTR
jgi:hypothetical protein